MSFEALKNAPKLPFADQLKILLAGTKINEEGERECLVTDIPCADGTKTGKMRLIISEQSLYDKTLTLHTQLSDPIYRKELERNPDEKQIVFEFFDLQRTIDQEIASMEDTGRQIEFLDGLFSEYEVSGNVEQFNTVLTPQMRNVFLEDQIFTGESQKQILQKGKKLTAQQITELKNLHADIKEMYPALREDVYTRAKLPTIKGRFAENGNIGEAMSIAIHSDALKGKQYRPC
jgi:hypothetical protein